MAPRSESEVNRLEGRGNNMVFGPLNYTCSTYSCAPTDLIFDELSNHASPAVVAVQAAIPGLPVVVGIKVQSPAQLAYQVRYKASGLLGVISFHGVGLVL